MKVFLGGTVSNSTWRQYVIKNLDIDYFDPVVKDWDEIAYQRELYERENCDYCLYVFTPQMEGYYAIAEVTDDSFKRPDRTIYCYLTEHNGLKFSDKQLAMLKKLGRIIEENGATWVHSLDSLIKLLNSANKRKRGMKYMSNQMNDVFISYGRRHSLHFARKLYDSFIAKGKKVWFDMNNIPLAVDFQEQIDDGIEKSDNFIFIISPHSVKSEYCLKEIMLALKYNKRIIPILHIEPSNCWDKMHPEIGKRNWVYIRQKENFDIPLSQWEVVDDYEKSFRRLLKVINIQQEYVRMHTLLLHKALSWSKHQRKRSLLLVEKDRTEAEKWLLKNEFRDEETASIMQPPCIPSDLQCEYIAESKKNAFNLMTQVFIAYTKEHEILKKQLRIALSRFAITTWTHQYDIEKGSNYLDAIQKGIAQADNFIYIISKETVQSEYCQQELELAISFNKRIIPLLLEPVEKNKLPVSIQELQYIDFSDIKEENPVSINEQTDFEEISLKERIEKDIEKRKEKTKFDKKIDELLNQINDDRQYYEQHKIILAQAIKWKNQNKNESILFRGFNLENAKTWQTIAKGKTHKPTDLHTQFIEESLAKVGLLCTEIFISYSRKDSDFSRRLNQDLQLTGKTTWFDQESIASSVDFQKEIFKGIEAADNFLFIISENSIKSPYCIDEVKYAATLGKRFIPILYNKPDQEELIPEQLNGFQWIDFDEKDYHISFSELIRTLNIDREYVQKHTKYSQLAIQWTIKNKNKDLLLVGNEQIIAQEWLQDAEEKHKQPTPTDIQKQFIQTGKDEILNNEEREKRRKIILKISLLGSLIAFFVAVYMLFVTKTAKDDLVKQKLEADSLRIVAEFEQQKAEKLHKEAIHQREVLKLALKDPEKAQLLIDAEEKKKALDNLIEQKATVQKIDAAKLDWAEAIVKIAEMWFEMQDFVSAIKYQKRAANIYESSRVDQKIIADSYLNISKYYLYKQSYDTCLTYAHRALKLNPPKKEMAQPIILANLYQGNKKRATELYKNSEGVLKNTIWKEMINLAEIDSSFILSPDPDKFMILVLQETDNPKKTISYLKQKASVTKVNELHQKYNDYIAILSERVPESVEHKHRNNEIYESIEKTFNAQNIKSADRHNMLKYANYCLQKERQVKSDWKKLKYVEVAVNLYEKTLSEMLEDHIIINAVRAYYLQTKYQIYNKQYHAAINSAQRGINLHNSGKRLNRYLALAYLMDGQYENAKKIYNEYMYDKYPTNSFKTFKEAFVFDLNDLEKKGFENKNIKKIRNYFKYH